MCDEEPGDQTPNVMEFPWLYPEQLAPPTVACTPATPGMQLDVWIQMSAGINVVQLLCASIHGIMKGPVPVGATWGICMDVRPSDIGIPAYN